MPRGGLRCRQQQPLPSPLGEGGPAGPDEGQAPAATHSPGYHPRRLPLPPTPVEGSRPLPTDRTIDGCPRNPPGRACPAPTVRRPGNGCPRKPRGRFHIPIRRAGCPTPPRPPAATNNSPCLPPWGKVAPQGRMRGRLPLPPIPGQTAGGGVPDAPRNLAPTAIPRATTRKHPPTQTCGPGMPGPQVCVGGCLRVVARGMAVGARFRGASGTPPPAVCPGMGGSGSLPLIRPCGATFPQGGRQGLLLVAAGGRGGVGHPALRMGIWKRPRGLRGHPFPGRRTVGAGHARPGGLRGHPSMVRSVGRGLDPSTGVGGSGSLRGWYPGEWVAAGACPSSGPAGPPSPKGEGKGCCWRQRKPPRGIGDAAPYGLPGNGR